MFKSAEEAMRKFQDKMATTLRELPPIIGEAAVNFTLDNFERQAWLGDNTENWQKRKNPTKWGKADDTGRALLVKTAKLKRSIRISRIVENAVYVHAGGADVPYARVHNEGFRGKVEQKVKAHTRKMKDGKTVGVSEFERTIQQNIPKRKFIGHESESPYLRAKIRRETLAHIRNRMKTI